MPAVTIWMLDVWDLARHHNDLSFGLQDADHVARVARFAIDAVAAAATVLVDVSDPSKGTVTLRAGFDCGPAMACVVGTRAKKFVLLGEARHFSLGHQNQIQPAGTT